MMKEMKSNQKEDLITKKNNKVKWWIDTTLNIIILGLLLFYFIHIQFGIGMKKVNMDIKTDCEGNIQSINNIPYYNYTEYNLSKVQQTIYESINKSGG